jgi:transcriptional regulatory protein LevR
MTIGKPETAKTTSTWTVIVYDYKNGQKTEYRNDLAKPIVSTADKLVTRRLLAAFAHNQGTDKNFILVNCFTGFGQASVVQSNLATVKEPTFDDCIPTLNANFPQFTLAKLRDQVGK